MTGSFAMFDWLLLAVSFYVLYSGIVGKGKLYSVENIKEGMEEEFRKFSQKIYIYLGITMIINSGATLLRNYVSPIDATTTDATAVAQTIDLGAFSFLTPKVLNIISIAALILTLALIVLLIVKMRKYIDKDAQSKAKQSTAARSGSSMPTSAFNFDEEDKKAK